MTADAMEGDRARSLAAGMDDYIGKPMRREELGAVLRRWIPASRAPRRVRMSRRSEKGVQPEVA